MQTILTNATGAYGLALSEYMLAVLMAMQKNYIVITIIKNNLYGKMKAK